MEKIKTESIVTLSTPTKDLCDKHLEIAKSNMLQLYKVANIEILEPEKFGEEKPYYSGHIEAEIEFKDVEQMFDFLVKFMPVSFEILDPSILKVPSSHLTTPLNQLIGDLQQIQNSKSTYETTFLHVCEQFHQILSSRERNKDAKLKEVLYKVFKPKKS